MPVSSGGFDQVTPPGAGLPELPPGFRFGVTSSAYQVEGATDVDGRGRTIWDTFAQVPGMIADGTAGDVGAGHHGRVAEDVALLGRLGVDDYRFSVSWARVQPDGRGRLEPRGLDFYDRLVDRVLEAGVSPVAVLHHHDLPQGLEDDGGWLNPATVARFADYAAVVGERLADRVAAWIPVYEPNAMAVLGYGNGAYAPGRTLYFDGLWAAHHLLLGHGHATVALRAAGAREVGCANNHAPMWPASEDAADVGATKLFDSLWNGLVLEPMLLGRYPADLAPLMQDLVSPGDLAAIRQPLDFYGVNYDGPLRVAAAPEDAPSPWQVLEPIGHPTADDGRAVVPDALREWLVVFRARFRAALPPIVVTEVGCAADDVPGHDGAVHDHRRVDYHRAHLQAVAEAVRRGVDVRGYHARSLLDGFEWTAGHTHRYGFVHVDRETLARTPKDSFDWYAALIAAQPRHLG